MSQQKQNDGAMALTFFLKKLLLRFRWLAREFLQKAVQKKTNYNVLILQNTLRMGDIKEEPDPSFIF